MEQKTICPSFIPQEVKERINQCSGPAEIDTVISAGH